jgi:hypothetical protein
MGQIKSKLSRRRAIATQQILPAVPDDLRFRVLIIGRANSGKTSILQRVCDTTESPEIYTLGPQGERMRVRCRSWWHRRIHHCIWSGSTRGITRGCAGLVFLLLTADHEDPACSVASTTWRMKSSLPITKDMFSMTPADSRQAVKTS